MMLSSRCVKMQTMVERKVEVEQCMVETSGQHCDKVERKFYYFDLYNLCFV